MGVRRSGGEQRCGAVGGNQVGLRWLGFDRGIRKAYVYDVQPAAKRPARVEEMTAFGPAESDRNVGSDAWAIGPAGADVIVLANPRSEFIDSEFAADLERYVAAGAGLLIYYSAYPPDTRVLSLGSLAALSPVC